MKFYRIRHIEFDKNGLHRVLLDDQVKLMCDSFGDYCDLETGQCFNPLYDEDGMLVGFIEAFCKYTI